MLEDDYKKYVIPFIKNIGYVIHPYVNKNYLFSSNDGYINIYYDDIKNIIHFQKCFYQDDNAYLETCSFTRKSA